MRGEGGGERWEMEVRVGRARSVAGGCGAKVESHSYSMGRSVRGGRDGLVRPSRFQRQPISQQQRRHSNNKTKMLLRLPYSVTGMMSNYCTPSRVSDLLGPRTGSSHHIASLLAWTDGKLEVTRLYYV